MYSVILPRSPEEVRDALGEVERIMGYGSANFTRSLIEAYRCLAEDEVREENMQQVRQFGERM